ncbi:cyclic peptide export ABC transporter [Lysobacter sp. ESA13C]|uniref:cyclic peptide export ABC transporter n=1 Tax=Lysobacter sp. ESA13C TaxID=2862676 RepID=UPI001CBF4E32|nr:cyclic peptide export ABC transporter [Lysobacter sp. ESA13C]
MIKFHVKGNAGTLVLATVLSALSAASLLMLLSQVGRIAREGLGTAAAALPAIGSLLAMIVTSSAAQITLAHLSAAVISGLRRELSRRFIALDYDRFLGVGPQALSSTLVADVTRVSTLLMLIPAVTFNFLLVASCLVYLAVLDLPLFAVLVCALAASVFTTVTIMRRAKNVFQAVREEEAELFEHFRAIGDGKKELAMSEPRATHFCNEVLERGVQRNRDLLFLAHKWWGLGQSWSMLAMFTTVFIVVLAGSWWLESATAVMSTFVVVLLFLIGPLNLLILASRDVFTGMASVRHIERMVGTLGDPEPARSTAGAHGRFVAGHWRSIALTGIEYEYQKGVDAFHLGPVSLSFDRGEVVFLVGSNGSGKSTMGLLLSGLVRPTVGHIEVDGMRIEQEDMSAYRSMFSAVFSDFHLFEDVVDRTGYAPSAVEVNALLRRLGLDGKVTLAGGAFSTVKVSQGQRKRLALAQAFVDDGDIFLFDEWAADQDQHFRRYFYTELIPDLKRRGKTIIAITHDENYFYLADRIVRFDAGRAYVPECREEFLS